MSKKEKTATVYTVNRSILKLGGKPGMNELMYCPIVKSVQASGANDPKLINARSDVLERFFRDELNNVLDENKKTCVRLTDELINRGVGDCLDKRRCILEVTPDIIADKFILREIMRLKREGMTIVINPMFYSDKHEQLFDFFDVIRFSIHSDLEKLKLTVAKCKEKGKICIADQVDTLDDFEVAETLDVDYVCGYFYAKPVMETNGNTRRPMVKTFLQVMAMLYSEEPDIEQIANIISSDPVLTMRLLRLINQLCADTGNKIATVHQALVMLGLEKLKEWIYLVGLQRLNREAPSELLRLALFRASMCEQIARVSSSISSKAKELYLMGLISIIIGAEDELQLDELDTLPVCDEIKQALIGKKSAYNTVFHLAYAYERANWKNVNLCARQLRIDEGALNMAYRNTVNFMKKFTAITDD